MKKSGTIKTLCLFFLGITHHLYCQDSQRPFDLIYHQDFSSPQALMDFQFTDPNAWSILSEGTNTFLSLDTQSIYHPTVRSPFNIAWLSHFMVGDFILEVRMAQTGREYGHRDLCIFFGGKDPSNFYYVHMASEMDDHANNIFIVNDAPRIKISTKTSEGTKWGRTDQWHLIKVVRNTDEGTIKVFFDDETEPIMEAVDMHFTRGRIGFGSFDDTGRVDDIKIWSPDYQKTFKSFFE